MIMNANIDRWSPQPRHCDSRRALLKSAMGIATLGIIDAPLLGVPELSDAAALTKDTRDKLTPDQIIEAMKQGNERFRTGKMSPHDYLAQKRATVTGQYPAAVILSCIDLRAPAEITLDARIGDTFNARIAGNMAQAGGGRHTLRGRAHQQER
jgi:carbonic anhydrase